jgi:HJR/Mrr/RecB family endonuclease
MNKVFDEVHYGEDDWAKYKVIYWLQKHDYKAWVNPDDYGIDVLATKDGKDYAFEVEVKHSWVDFFFPFQEVHFSARKLKFVLYPAEVWFVMLNNELTNSLFVSAEDFNNVPIVQKNTVYSSAEMFVEVPVGLVRFIDFSEV